MRGSAGAIISLRSPMAERLDFFHLLPGVWDETAEVHGVIGMQLRVTLAAGKPLNSGERLVLLELLQRLRGSREARRALGFKIQRSRTWQRNAQIADEYVALKASGLSRAKAESMIMSKHQVGAKALQKITDSRALLSRARGRLVVRRWAERAARGEQIEITNAGQLKALLAGDPPNFRK